MLWLTGLPAAGKTTIAIALEFELRQSGLRVSRIDGDDLRRGLCADLGYSAADRSENVRRAASLARLFAESGGICIAALISPYRADREMARRMVAPAGFIEVYVATALDACRRRDPKGLYRKAELGELGEFTGISAPYEPPLAPEIVVHTERATPAQCAFSILEYLRLTSKNGGVARLLTWIM